MLLATVQEEATLSGGGESAAFTVKTSSKIFDMLASGIYKDKYLAPLREIACNAFDAHVAVGKADVPIKVHLPVALEPWLAIRDYGVGLSYEDVMRMYTSYGESTKDVSNDFIGGFGLGSKSPFAYADSFSVTSWFNGKKSEYALYKDGTRAPTITHISTVDTTEGNGFEVHMPVQRGDISTFVQRARDFFAFWPVKPTVNVKLDYPTYEAKRIIKFKTGELQVGPERNWRGSPVIKAIMGNVSYDLDFTQLNSDLGRRFQQYLEKYDFGFFTLPIGSLAVAISRETVSYEPQTIQFLQSLLDEWAANIEADIQKAVAAETSYVRALWRLKKEWNAFNSFLSPNVLFKWQNETLNVLDTSFSIDDTKVQFKRAQPWGDTWTRKSVYQYNTEWLYSLPDFNLQTEIMGYEIRLVVDDVKGESIWARYRQIVAEYPNGYFHFVEGDLKYLLDLLRIDDSNVLYLSKFTPVIQKRAPRDKSIPITIWKINKYFVGSTPLGSGESVEEVSMPIDDLETLPGIYATGYMTTHSWAKTYFKPKVYTGASLYDGLTIEVRCVLGFKQPVYLIPKRYMKRIDGNPALKSVDAFIAETVASVTEAEQRAYMARLFKMSSHPWQLSIPSYRKEFDGWRKLCDSLTEDRVAEISAITEAFGCDWDPWSPQLDDFKKEFPLYDSIPSDLLSEYVKLQKFWNDNHSASPVSSVNP